jgi:DNA modification methylase
MTEADETLDFIENKLILGDNLEILKELPEESVDLIYLDPPFFSNQNYEVIWGDDGEVRSFQDRWSGGIDHYIGWLYERVEQMHRVLKETGSIYLHCDYHANAEIKVFVLNKIFGNKNFRNEIIWCYTGPSSPGMTVFPRKSDTIFWYTKSNKWTFNQCRIPYKDPNQRPRKAFDTGNSFTEEAITAMRERGKPIENWWSDIAVAVRSPRERIGYPTQKPEALIGTDYKSIQQQGRCGIRPIYGRRDNDSRSGKIRPAMDRHRPIACRRKSYGVPPRKTIRHSRGSRVLVPANIHGTIA